MGLMQTFVETTDTLADVKFQVDIESNLNLVLVFELIESVLETNSWLGLILIGISVVQGFVCYSSILKRRIFKCSDKVGLACISN